MKHPIKTPNKAPSMKRKSPGTYNGEPGWPKRTGSSSALPEKTYDHAGPLNKGRKGIYP